MEQRIDALPLEIQIDDMWELSGDDQAGLLPALTGTRREIIHPTCQRRAVAGGAAHL
jgi:hypothetical protein